MPNLTEKSIQKMREVIALIERQADLYDQNAIPGNVVETPCESVCCAAGFVARLFAPELVYENGYAVSILDEISGVLGLPSTPVSENLFAFARHWPRPFCSDYAEATTNAERAAVLKARWEHFIARDGG